MSYSLRTFYFIFALLLFIPTTSGADPLPSWSGGPIKQSIVKFVKQVTDRQDSDYVEPADRIATFDNDGTLWCEKPLCVHLQANLMRIDQLVKETPELGKQQPYQAIQSKDVSYFVDLFEKGQTDEVVGDLFGVPFVGLTTEEYSKWNRNWFDTWQHPRFQKGYRELTYQPMVELVKFLQEHQFDVHIVTGDEGAFVKLVSQQLYGIPPQNVHGSSIKLEYEVEGEVAQLRRTAETKYFDNWDAKPRLIYQEIGKRPIFAAGNSNGDLHMLQYTSQQTGPSMSILIHHTDAEREYAYDGHTEKVIPLAKKEGWAVVDMKKDWKVVFSTAITK